ncbi:alpha/beta hydrolase [Bacillus massiliigorillae]|uniref:alpha/beta hydrolase n=1 Tax=Bacillus massiliigorillae TaxID=1243664 RepID=UPI00039EE2B4|nr:alpha/beta hydrolase [Bacillus massiliigorillae]
MKRKGIFALGAILTSLIGIGVYFTNILMFMKKKDASFIKEREIKAKRWVVEDFDALPKKQVSVASPFGYNLDCLFIHPYPSKKWMIFCHGITENKYNSIKYMNVFLERGYNAVIYDHRRHGESGGKTSSYGYYEKWDLEVVVKELKSRFGKDIILGIHGESMGAVTTLLYGGSIRDDADFYIADCPFTTLQDQLHHRLKVETPLPSWLVLPIGNAFLKLRDGYRFQDVSPLEAVKNITKPVLFIHSELDDYIPASMTKQLYEAKKGPKQLFIAANGFHAQSLNENKQQYEKAVDRFLQTYS